MANDLSVVNPDDSDDPLKSLADKIRKEFNQLGLAFHKSADHARRIGDFFIAAKAECKKRGQHFEPWVRAEFEISERTAQAYMRVTNKWDELDKAQALAPFRIESALKLLANPKPPKPPDPPEPPLSQQSPSIGEQQDQDIIDAEFEPHGDLPAPADEKAEPQVVAAESEADGGDADVDQIAHDPDEPTTKAEAVAKTEAVSAVVAMSEFGRAAQQLVAVDKDFDANPDPADEDYDRHEAARQRVLEALRAAKQKWSDDKLRRQKAAVEDVVNVLAHLEEKLPTLPAPYKKKFQSAMKYLQEVADNIDSRILG